MATEAIPFTDSGEPPSETRAVTVPYMSFQGFRHLLDRLVTEGLPQLFDRSFFGEVSGSLVAQTRGTLKFFDLIDDDKRPTELLRTVASTEGDERIAILRELAEKKYSAVIALGTDATQGQLVEAFRATGLSGQSVTKAISFYMSLADYTGLPVSPFFRRAPARTTASSANSSRRASSRRKKPPIPPESTVSPVVHRAVDSLGEKKSAYIDLLMKLAEQSGEKGEVQADLLDRLERALGYETSPSEREGG